MCIQSGFFKYALKPPINRAYGLDARFSGTQLVMFRTLEMAGFRCDPSIDGS